ncbi:MAG: hypothetical protein IIA58_00955 [Candidatus Marinimicrobia bacterium]|nr:hypothetical protein [Candidatus Neomarinimicrobiota bacterium]
MTPNKISLTIITLLFSIAVGRAQSTDVDPDYRGYDFLDILSSRGMISGFYNNVIPLTRERFGELLLQAEKKYSANSDLLTPTEIRILQRLKGDLLSDPNDGDVEIDAEFRERHLFTWSEEDSWFAADGIFIQENDIGVLNENGDKDNSSRTTAGGRVRGYLAGSLHFYLEFTNTKISGGEPALSNFDPSRGLPAVAYDGFLYRDDAVTYLKYTAPWLDLTVGRQKIRWGPGGRSGVTLSSSNPPMDVIRLDVRYSRLSYSGFIGDIRGTSGNKKIAAHRIDFIPFKGLRLGGGETVVYNRAKFEILYSLPLMPFHIAEHHLGDKDNNGINFDVEYTGIVNGRVYAELFIDDYKLAKNPLTHWGNKWAILAGLQLTKPLNLPNSSLLMEYTRVEPYVYTHILDGNDYFNYDRSIGQWSGPDSDEIFVSYRNRPNWRSVITLSWSMLRKGRLDETVSFPETKELEDAKEFLSGVVERRFSYTLRYSIEFAKDQFIQIEGRALVWKNYNRVEKDDRKNNVLFLSYKLDF